MIFHSLDNRMDENPIVKIGKKTIQRDKFVKFLGLLLDENLSWKFHLKELSKKLSNFLEPVALSQRLRAYCLQECYSAYVIHCSYLSSSVVLL